MLSLQRGSQMDVPAYYRLLLVWPLGVAASWYWWRPEHPWWLLVVAVSTSTYCVLLNVPQLVLWSHSRPVWFEDLEDPLRIEPHYKRRFQRYFIMLHTLVIVVMVASTVYYYFHKYEQSSLGLWAILGLIGGVLNLVQLLETYAGNLLISCVTHVMARSAPNSGRLDPMVVVTPRVAVVPELRLEIGADSSMV